MDRLLEWPDGPPRRGRRGGWFIIRRNHSQPVSRDELVTAIFYHISTRGTSRLLQIALANDTCPNLGAKQTETTLSTSK
jgi:hypothetical protein